MKAEHGLKPSLEAKWTKISPAKAGFYLALINLYLADDRLRFRSIVVPNKKTFSHGTFSQSHDDWHNSMYFTMLRAVIKDESQYRFYFGVRDTRGGPRIRRLRRLLANNRRCFDHESTLRVQQVRSQESELLQLTDILTGALAYANRNLTGSQAKLAVVERLRSQLGSNILNQTSAVTANKFNLLVWQGQEVAG